MKIHILHNFQAGPWGGGNQFLKALKKEFSRMGVYEENSNTADVILFNSYQRLKDVIKLKSKHPSKLLIHRLGPIFHYHRGISWKAYDRAVIEFANKISDGVIFQSQWSKKQALELGFNPVIPNQIIYNAAQTIFFNKKGKKPFNPREKIKLIAVSWSGNPHKGFAFYKYLDENLDFSKYEMTFIGNSSVKFKNIKAVNPMGSEKISESLKQSDIFIFPAKYEACSNSLIEAMSCGLPVVALDSGSNRELIQTAGQLFEVEQDLIAEIDKVAENYTFYQNLLPEFFIEKTAQDYFKFASRIFNNIKQGHSKPKKMSFFLKLGLQRKLFTAKIKTKV